jgi:hypothetical protein
MLRGGSWNNNAPFVRAANRNNNDPDNRNNNIGFRCVVVASMVPKGQVSSVYGREVSAQGEHIPGLFPAGQIVQPKNKKPCPVW